MRLLPLVHFALAVSLVGVACGGDDSDNGTGVVPPSNCMDPCSGQPSPCFGPPEPNCNGSWYCWSDDKWHCAPEEAGGPPDATLFDTGSSDDGPDETGPADTGPAETGPADTGPAETGPAETGPAETGPADTGPAETGPIEAGPG